MNDKIVQRLAQIERVAKIKVLYACESGSRAWGLESQDSDYDVRFLYMRPFHEILMPLPVRQVGHIIDRNNHGSFLLPQDEEDKLDFAGWSLHKAMQLLHNTNVSIHEWLQSPIVYGEPHHSIESLQRLAPLYFDPARAYAHYIGLARNTLAYYLRKDRAEVNAKKYFYALRPILASYWVREFKTCPPSSFYVLLSVCSGESLLERQYARAIENLVDWKLSGLEVDSLGRHPALDDFIEMELDEKRTEATREQLRKRGFINGSVHTLNNIYANVSAEFHLRDWFMEAASNA